MYCLLKLAAGELSVCVSVCVCVCLCCGGPFADLRTMGALIIRIGFLGPTILYLQQGTPKTVLGII